MTSLNEYQKWHQIDQGLDENPLVIQRLEVSNFLIRQITNQDNKINEVFKNLVVQESCSIEL
jgi:hypothetical protein